MDAHAHALRERRDRLATALCGPAGGLKDGALLVPSGLVVPIDGSDQQQPYRPHDDHAYLCGTREVGQVLAFEGDSGWSLFAREASAEDRVWHGEGLSLEDQAAASGVSRVRPLAELPEFLGQLRTRPVAWLGSMDLLERPGGYGVHPGEIEALALDADASARAAALVVDARRRKDAVELDFMRAAVAASAAGHVAAMQQARAGWSERRVGLEVDFGFLRAGAERPAYATIAVTGERCAVLHAAPSERVLRPGDLVLVDAGAEVQGYDSDITRTWPVSARYGTRQRALYELVLRVQEGAIAELRPGVEYRDLHLRACRMLAAGLVDLGLLRGDPDGLVEQDAHAVFFPHGLGHLLGLATHDVGGYPAGRTRSSRMGLKYLRIDLPMEAGFVVTIEPGLYFIRALLEDPELHARLGDAVNWTLAREWLPLGGVRIEDDVLVTEGEAEVLSAAIPKDISALEALRA